MERLVASGATSAKVNNSPPTALIDSPPPSVYPPPPSHFDRSVAGIFAAAADPSILASAPDISRQLLLEKGSLNLSRSKRAEMVKALASIDKFYDFLKRWKLVGLTPFGPAGALLMQQAVAIMAQFHYLKDPWAPVRAYMMSVLTAAGLSDKDVTDRTVFDFLMQGYEFLARQHDKSNLLCSLDPWGKEAMFQEATRQQLRDKEATNNKQDRQDRSTRRPPPNDSKQKDGSKKKKKKKKKKKAKDPASQAKNPASQSRPQQSDGGGSSDSD